jgi:hypothetical protein
MKQKYAWCVLCGLAFGVLSYAVIWGLSSASGDLARRLGRDLLSCGMKSVVDNPRQPVLLYEGGETAVWYQESTVAGDPLAPRESPTAAVYVVLRGRRSGEVIPLHRLEMRASPSVYTGDAGVLFLRTYHGAWPVREVQVRRISGTNIELVHAQKFDAKRQEMGNVVVPTHMITQSTGGWPMVLQIDLVSGPVAQTNPAMWTGTARAEIVRIISPQPVPGPPASAPVPRP